MAAFRSLYFYPDQPHIAFRYFSYDLVPMAVFQLVARLVPGILNHPLFSGFPQQRVYVQPLIARTAGFAVAAIVVVLTRGPSWGRGHLGVSRSRVSGDNRHSLGLGNDPRQARHREVTGETV